MKTQSETFKGFCYGVLSSASFGLIPFFAVPLLKQGMGFDSVLFYRFLFACVALAVVLMITKQSFRITLKDFWSLVVLAIFYDISSLFLMWGYLYMGSGVATTLHFMYPVFTTLMMMLFFKEKKSARRIIAVLLAVTGVFFLSYDGTGTTSIIGIIIVLISAVGYALYLVTVSILNIKHLSGLRLTFYVFLIGGGFLFIILQFRGGLHPIESWESTQSLLLLALIPTVVSNLSLVQAIKRIGSTLTSVLGAMEPVTALIVGVIVFQETLSAHAILGIVLVLGAVLLIILHKK
ncbi:DMT family transporter [Bacteroides sp. 214]|uniref:DMT family transporter n=1 Tax=Bacteroides sp. 214 TaxID=2302935 RepID=UPI0013D6AB6E|nr:DMT family transporter [Bacteroides sp. 214]NDW11661.1 DMT family transporter [Bacteroides sp. 214]